MQRNTNFCYFDGKSGFGTDRERGEKELQELVEEIFQKNFERTERVKVIPYAALLIEKTARDGKADTYLK